MRKTPALVLGLLVAMVSGVPGLAEREAPRTAITGFPPYNLGAEVASVLKADPALQAGAQQRLNGRPATRSYSRKILAPINGITYQAMLVVQFWQGDLAAVEIHWPLSAFYSFAEQRQVAYDLEEQIAGTYATDLIKTRARGYLVFADAQGNLLQVFDDRAHFELSLTYLWAPFAEAISRSAAR
jgi:hypothetical protein